MQAGATYTERHNQVVGIVYRNTCWICGLDPSKTKWKILQKIVESNKEKILWDFSKQTQEDKQVVINQPDIVVDKSQKSVLIDRANRNDRKKEYEKLEKLEEHRELKEELDKMWEVKPKVILVRFQENIIYLYPERFSSRN